MISLLSMIMTDTIDTMNDSFHTPSSAAGRWLNGFFAKLGAGGAQLLRLFETGGARPVELEIAAQKRALESKLLAAGYSRKLALIAVSEAFAKPAKPD